MRTQTKDWAWFNKTIDRMAAAGVREAEVRAVLLKQDTHWSPYACRVYLTPVDLAEEDGGLAPGIYGRIAFLRKVISVNAVVSSERKETLLGNWPGLTAIAIPAEQPPAHLSATFYGSRNLYGPRPLWSIPVGNGVNARGLDNDEILLHRNLPLFNSVAQAAARWLHDPSIERNDYPGYLMHYVFQPSQLYLNELLLKEDGNLEIDLKPLLPGSSPLFLKVAARAVEGTSISFDEAILDSNHQRTLALGSAVTELRIFIIDEDGQPHDFFRETPQYCSWPGSVLLGEAFAAQRQLADVIYQGEGATLEFKEWLPLGADKAKRHELHRTLVAFANTEGGSLLIGVDNEGEIRGLGRALRDEYSQAGETIGQLLDRYRRDLWRSIREGIAPAIEVDFRSHQIDNNLVLEIRVNKGAQRPYHTVPGNDIYIRRHGSNRRPGPDDLEQLRSGNVPLIL